MARNKKNDTAANDTEVIENQGGTESTEVAEGAATSEENGSTGKTGSIVKKKYAGRYKDHRDGLSAFIAEQCNVEGVFKYERLFDLCRENGIKEEQIDPYKDILDPDKKVNGLAGRTRMTLRNRLAAIVRKNEGKIKAIDGTEHNTDTAPITVRTPTMDKAKETSGEGVAAASAEAEAEAA